MFNNHQEIQRHYVLEEKRESFFVFSPISTQLLLTGICICLVSLLCACQLSSLVDVLRLNTDPILSTQKNPSPEARKIACTHILWKSSLGLSFILYNNDNVESSLKLIQQISCLTDYVVVVGQFSMLVHNKILQKKKKKNLRIQSTQEAQNHTHEAQNHKHC